MDEQTLVGFTPSLSPGQAELWVVRSDNEIRRNDRLAVYRVPRIQGVESSAANIVGGTEHVVRGTSLLDVFSVRVGSSLANLSGDLRDDAIRFVAPALPPGRYDLTLFTPDVEVTLDDGFGVVDPGDLAFSGRHIAPSVLRGTEGGQVLVFGSGFTPTTSVSLQGTPLACQFVGAVQLSCLVPPNFGAGTLVLAVAEGGNSATFDLELVDVSVTAVEPTEVPARVASEIRGSRYGAT